MRKVRQYTKLLQEIKVELSRHCQEFAEGFFHGKTKGEKKMCMGEILQLTFR